MNTNNAAPIDAPVTPLREFGRYSGLSIISMLGVSCYILADTLFVSKGLGTAGLAALNLAIPIYNFIYGSGLMLGMGGAIKFSIYKSRGEEKAVNKTYTSCLYMGLFFSLIFVLLGLWGDSALASLLGADQEVFQMTRTYLRWLLLFAPAFILSAILLCFVRNDGAPGLSMGAMLAGSFANIILDYIFIFPMGMGIFGAVFATGLSPVISIVIMAPHWITKKNTFHLTAKAVSPAILSHTLSLGVPSLIGQLSSGIVMLVFNFIILDIEGNVGVAAYGVIANIALVVIGIYTGMGQGVQPLISRSYGSNDQHSVKIFFKYSMILMAGFSVLLYALLYILADPIAGIFNSEGNIHLQSLASEGIRLYFTSNIFAGYNILLSTYFTSVQKAMPAQVLSLLRSLILIIPISVFFAKAMAMTGVWLAFPATEMMVAFAGLWAYHMFNAEK